MPLTAGIELSLVLAGRCHLGRGVRTGPQKEIQGSESPRIEPTCVALGQVCDVSVLGEAALDTDPEQFLTPNRALGKSLSSGGTWGSQCLPRGGDTTRYCEARDGSRSFPEIIPVPLLGNASKNGNGSGNFLNFNLRNALCPREEAAGGGAVLCKAAFVLWNPRGRLQQEQPNCTSRAVIVTVHTLGSETDTAHPEQ